MSAAQRIGIAFDLRDIDTESGREELLRLGGKIQVPYLVDEKRGVRMYESGDIIRYLQESRPSS